MGVKVREKPKGSGVYWIFINHQGKRASKLVGPDKDQADQVASLIKLKLDAGQYEFEKPKPKAPKFKAYALKWLNGYIKTLRRSSTYERYNDILTRHVFPAIGTKPIDNIKRSDIRDLLLSLHEQGLARSSISLTRDVLSGPMGYAVDEELIMVNPVTGVLKRLGLERDKRLKVKPLTYGEVELFLNTCNKHFSEYYVFFLCAFRTGLRLGELLALKWGDVDWNGKFLNVERSFRRGKVDKTKNGKDRRVDMSDQLTEALEGLHKRRKREALKAGIGKPIDIIFHRQGRHMEQNYIRRVYKRVLKKAGIRDMRVHDARHTYASLLLSNGESPAYVKEQMGHSSITITIDIYGHLIPGSNREAVNRLDSPPKTHPKTHPKKAKAATR